MNNYKHQNGKHASKEIWEMEARSSSFQLILKLKITSHQENDIGLQDYLVNSHFPEHGGWRARHSDWYENSFILVVYEKIC